MSTRAANMMRDDMEAMGAVRLKDVDEAQGRMVNTAKDSPRAARSSSPRARPMRRWSCDPAPLASI